MVAASDCCSQHGTLPDGPPRPVIKRRTVQTISLILLHSSWGPELKWFCNPVLSCHSCALAYFACPIGVFVHYSGYHLFPFFAIGMVAVFGVLIGRMLCGWVCPFGFLMDLLHKIPSPKFTLPNWTGYTKYLILALTVFLTPYLFGESTLLSYCRLCPASAIQVTIPNLIQNGFGTANAWTFAKLGVLAAIVLLAIMSERAFCKTLCPIAAIMGPFNYLSFWAMKNPGPQPCPGCKLCDKACPTDVQPLTRMAVDIPANRTDDCIVCHDCQNACPAHGRKVLDVAPAE